MRTYNLPENDLRDHVVIAGHGQVGGFVAQLLQRLDQRFVVVDNNPGSADAARDAGLPVVYGDASAEPVLEAAGTANARLVILTIPDALDARLVVSRIRAFKPDLHIVARSSTADQLQDLSRLGVYEAVQPEFEAGLELGRQALSHLGIGAGEIQQFSDQVRRELYAPVSGRTTDDSLLERLRRTSRMIETEWIELPEESRFAGRSIGELQVRTESGASVVAVVRGEELLANPGPEVRLSPGDTVGFLGTPDQRESFRSLADGR